MPQFFTENEIVAGMEVLIRGAEARHISEVLRLRSGDWIVLSDGSGRSFRSIIKSVKQGSVKAAIKEEIIRTAANPPPALALAVIKKDRFEWAIEKAVELGASRIIPFLCERTVPRYLKDATEAKEKRWTNIALAAAKQSGLPVRPEIGKILKFGELCAASKNFGTAILFYEGEKDAHIGSILKNRDKSLGGLLIIGPEGGFTDEEVKAAKESGIQTASLGTQILRVETAAIAALSVWQYEAGGHV